MKLFGIVLIWLFGSLSVFAQPFAIDWITVPGGSFMMGNLTGDDNERPLHAVTLSPFQMSKHEITVGQYRAFCAQTGRDMPAQPVWSQGENWPVVNVSWTDAGDFSVWAGGHLPTEAEWEYAALGGTSGIPFRYSGSNDADSVAWLVTNDGQQAHPVGIKAPNEFGIHDLSGNVWEWCADWYSSSYYKISPAQNPPGPTAGFQRVVRGGGWYNKSKNAYIRLRFNIGPGYRYDDLGFRIAKKIS